MKTRRKEMDRLDWRILAALAKNPSRSFMEIKDELKVSVGTVYMRTKRLKEDWGVIKGQRLILDPKKLGYAFVAFIRIQVADVQKALDFFRSRPEVGVVYQITGEFNLAVEAYFRSVEELRGFTTELVKAGAQRIESQLVLDKPIDNGVPVPEVASPSEAKAPKTRRKS